jgi:hypothetical protein
MEVSIGIYAIIFIFFFLITPGFLARRFFYHGEFSKQINLNSNSFMNVIYSLFVGIMLSLVFIYISNCFINNTINIDTILNDFDSNFISTNQESNNLGRFNGLTNNMKSYYLPFIGAIYVFSSMVGYFSSKIILFFNWDTRWKFLRFNNNWHYQFSGRILKFKKNLSVGFNHKLKVKYTYLDILVSENGEKSTLYSGLFADYDINPQDTTKLEKIHLYKASRYKKVEDAVEIKNIPGNLFTIMGNNILNINCTYICYDEDETKFRKFIIQKNILFPLLVFSTLFFLSILVSFIFSINIVNTEWYKLLLSQSFIFKTIFIFTINIVIGLVTPFQIKSSEKKVVFIGFKPYFYKIILSIVMIVVLYVMYFGFTNIIFSF